MTKAWPWALIALASPGWMGWAQAGSGDRELVEQLDREVIALRQRVVLLEKYCGSDQTPAAIYPELVSIFSGTPVAVSRQGPRALVTFQADDLFSADALTLREEVQPWMDLLAVALDVNAQTNVVIVGHWDGSQPPANLRARYPTGWEWSMALANAVGENLIRRYGLQPGRMTLGSRSSWDPVASNDTPEGRAVNRRVVVHLSDGKYP